MMATAATPLTVTVTAKFVGKDWGSPPEAKKGKNIIVMFSLSSDKTLSNGYYFVVDELTAIKLVSITRWKRTEYTPVYITVTVNYTFSSTERPNRLGRRGLDAKLDILFLFLYGAAFWTKLKLKEWECYISLISFDVIVESVVPINLVPSESC